MRTTQIEAAALTLNNAALALSDFDTPADRFTLSRIAQLLGSAADMLNAFAVFRAREITPEVFAEVCDISVQRFLPVGHLRQALEAFGSEGGHVGYKGGSEWDFVTTDVTFTPAQLNALFYLAGVQPKKIQPLGSCSACKWSIQREGKWVERGYSLPCLVCVRPRMSRFEAADR